MALFTIDGVRSLARAAAGGDMYKADAVMRHAEATFASSSSYDIFLSHSFSDAQIIFGVGLALEDYGYSVYIDWREDRGMNRDRVTKETAATLKIRMASCRSLFYATTENAQNSKWMPWELGYFDGLKAKSAILPVLGSRQSSDVFTGQEYLGLYPYIADGATSEGKDFLWVHESEKRYVRFDAWLEGKAPKQH